MFSFWRKCFLTSYLFFFFLFSFIVVEAWSAVIEEGKNIENTGRISVKAFLHNSAVGQKTSSSKNLHQGKKADSAKVTKKERLSFQDNHSNEDREEPPEAQKGKLNIATPNPTPLQPRTSLNLVEEKEPSAEEVKQKILTTIETEEEKKLSPQEIHGAASTLTQVASHAQQKISDILGDADLANSLLIGSNGSSSGHQAFRLVPTSALGLTDLGNQFQLDIIEPGSRVMSLDDCIKTALEKNPDILAAIDQVRVKSGNYIQVRSALLPHFGAKNSSYEWIDPNVNNPQGKADDQVPINQLWQIKLAGTQLITDGGKALANTAAAHFSEQIAYYQLRQTIDRIIANVIDDFYRIILERSLVAATQESVAIQANYLEDQKSRYDVGSVSRFDVLQAQVQLNNTKPELIDNRNKLRVAFFDLMQLMGLDYSHNSDGRVPFNIKGKLDYYPRKIHREQSIYTALQRNPNLKAQRQNILVMAKRINAAIGNFFPTINFEGGYEYLSADRSVTGSDGTTSYAKDVMNFVSGWFFGLQGEWPIFDGLGNYGELKTSQSNMMVAKANYDNEVRKVIFEVQEAISNVQRTEAVVESQKENLAQAAEAFQLAQERVNAGAPKAIQLDVLNGQRALLTAQTTLLQAQYDYIAAIAEYDRALSLNTQYAEMFDDPMNKYEKARYKKWVVDNYLQPALPKKLRNQDPLPTSLVEKPTNAFEKLLKAGNKNKRHSHNSKTPYSPMTEKKLTPHMGESQQSS